MLSLKKNKVNIFFFHLKDIELTLIDGKIATEHNIILLDGIFAFSTSDAINIVLIEDYILVNF